MSVSHSVHSSRSGAVVPKYYLPWRNEEEDAEEVEDEIRFITKNNEFLAFENTLLNAFLNQNLGSISFYDESNLNTRSQANQRRRRNKIPFITFPQRIEIATKIIDSYKEDIVKIEDDSEKMAERLTCMLKATKERIVEIKNEAFQFKKDCLPINKKNDLKSMDSLPTITPNSRTTTNPRNVDTSIQAEKIIRHLENLIKQKTNKIEKTRLSITANRSKASKMQTQIAQKERFGETFQRIDYEELKIEKRQFEETLQKKNSELLNLKLIAGNSITQLQSTRDILNKLETEANAIKSNIKNESNLIAKLNNDIKQVLNENEKLKQRIKVLKLQAEKGHGPGPEDYRQLIRTAAELEKEIATLKRQVSIHGGVEKRIISE
eukprot:TRINITY_DN2091_c0_g1_i1.p1 TRINITY_DN2091_c0_g1~~TRINITY_DN2091_c0_g1_i1.p1  ORF type:complete len:378 (-),score=125.87 TRINITY_DN2091_c0_g1_i1:111-1244(-)